MNNKKTTKRALLSSVMAIVLCLAMLIGTTFAWFTDSASTAVNKIQAGTLDIGLEMKDASGNWVNAEGKTLGWVAEDDRAQNEIFWEPDCTYKLPTLKITNKGNLALQFKVLINGISGNMELLDALEFTYSYAWYNESSVVDSGSFEGSNLNNLPYEIPCNLDNLGQIGATEYDWRGYPLNVGTFTLSGTNMGFYTLQAHMKESAGNEYQGKVLENLSITVVATQVAGFEMDSFDDLYDKDAEYPVVTASELTTALAEGGIVAINNDITADATKTAAADRITVAQPTTLNLDAKFIVPGELEPTANWAGLYIKADTVINATENGGIQCLDKAANGKCGTYVANIMNGANVTVNGGTYYGGGTTFQVQEGILTINGGHFEVTPFGDPYNYNFLLNCVDANYRNGTAKIIVKGGTFVNFDPSNNSAEGAGTNFVADGYTVVSETQSNGDIWYTVVPA